MEVDDESIIAKTIYNEARGEGYEGMQAVAATIQNRYKLNRGYMGNRDFYQICVKAYEGAIGCDPSPAGPEDEIALEYCKELAAAVKNLTVPDNTGGCTHFATTRNAFDRYSVDGKMVYKMKLGNHYFFQEF